MRSTASTSLASNLRRASDSSIVQSRWDSGEIKLMTREIGKLWFMQKNTSRFARVHLSRLFALLISLFSVVGCTGKSSRPVFKLLGPEETGVTFANTITTTDSFNVQTDVYIYNGAGVAVGDIDNDGLPDIFFSGNMVSSRLYLNKGHMRFEDITEAAGVGTKRDRKSTRLNSSHGYISYAVFCLKKKKKHRSIVEGMPASERKTRGI